MIDFTNVDLDILSKYGGSDQKISVEYGGKRYMLKLSNRIPDSKQNSLNSSYSNSAFSEHICCSLIKSYGFTVQNTLLGFYKKTSSKGEMRTYPVVACENFLQKDEVLIEFKVIESALLEDRPHKIPSLDRIYTVFKSDNTYFDREFGKQAINQYWDEFILDAFLGNFDRHGNNWGYIINSETKAIKLAPIYDCGSCLYPGLADDAIERVIENQEEIQKRIEEFPKAALSLTRDGEKISYKDFLTSALCPDCNAALLRVFPKIDLNISRTIIDSTEGISSLRKEFYNKMLSERYHQILLPAYERALELHKEKEEVLPQLTL